MATYNQERIIKEYWERVKDQYPDVPFEKFSEACKYPAIFIKNVIKSGSLKTIMIKWMGKFIVYPARFKRNMVKQEVFREKGIITEEEYQAIKQKFDWFMDEFERESPGFILVRKTENKPQVEDFGSQGLIYGTAGEMNTEGLNKVFYNPETNKTDI